MEKDSEDEPRSPAEGAEPEDMDKGSEEKPHPRRKMCCDERKEKKR